MKQAVKLLFVITITAVDPYYEISAFPDDFKCPEKRWMVFEINLPRI